MNSTTSFDPKELSLPVLHGYLLAAIAPRPIAFASTIDKKGRVNLSPFSFFNVFSANPPVMIFSPARRGKDNTTKHTYENTLEVPEVVINTVNYPMVYQVSLASTEYGKEINEFEKAGLTTVPSETVKPPRVAESPVSFECRVNQVIPLGKLGGAGNLVIAEVQRIHVQSRYLDDQGRIMTDQLDLVGRMGGNWYCRSSGSAMFQVPKPRAEHGMGVDQLPASIRDSPILTGNSLGKLGSISQLPSPESVHEWEKDPAINPLLQYQDALARLHHLAQDLLENDDTDKAFLTLMVAHRLHT